MVTVSRQERAQRRQRDGGDPDDTVYHGDGVSVADRAYHDDPECRHLARYDETDDCTREKARGDGRYPCKVCVLGDGGVGGAGPGASPAQLMQRQSVTSIEDLRREMATRNAESAHELGKALLYEEYWGNLNGCRTIAEEYGVARSSIMGWMEEYGIPRRPNWWRPDTKNPPWVGFYTDGGGR